MALPIDREVTMNLYNTSVTFVYRNGSKFTEHYAKPLNVGQLVDKVLQAQIRANKESNIIDVKLHVERLDTQN